MIYIQNVPIQCSFIYPVYSRGFTYRLCCAAGETASTLSHVMVTNPTKNILAETQSRLADIIAETQRNLTKLMLSLRQQQNPSDGLVTCRWLHASAYTHAYIIIYMYIHVPCHMYVRSICLHNDIHGMIVLHLGLEGCSQPRELWFSDILMYTHVLCVLHIHVHVHVIA